MDGERRPEVWASGAQYEPYVGRWSRLVARELLAWLGAPLGWRWLDAGCGTGALTQTILERAGPSQVVGIDPSRGFVAYARAQVTDPRARFDLGDGQALPYADGSFDAAVAGLVLNFLPDPARGVAELVRVVRPGGLVAAYVWDYAGKMELMRHFWDAAVALDPAAALLDEGRRFPLCSPPALRRLFSAARLQRVAVRAIDVPTRFRDFDDYWTPFLGGQGPAPTYVASLSTAQRNALRGRIRAGLPFAPDGSIPLTTRAWAVRGFRRGPQRRAG